MVDSFELTVAQSEDNYIILKNMDGDILISDVKFLVSLFCNIPIENQILHFDEDILINEKTLEHHRITSSSSVRLTII